MANRHEITRSDILSMADYEKIRAERRRSLLAAKRARRVPIGPYATAYFESWDTMWLQIHEMLYIEKGGEEQIADELSAYNPLVPKGRELVCTLMFEIDDPVRRKAFLSRLGGVEERCLLVVGGEEVRGVPEADVDRTTADGKASSVQFIHFPFSDAQVALFRQPAMRVVLEIRHPAYGHMAVLPEETRAALAGDFD